MRDEEGTVIRKIRKLVDWRKLVLLTSSLVTLLVSGILVPEVRDISRVVEFFQSISVLTLLAVGLSWLYLSGIRDFSLGGWYLLAIGLAQLWQNSSWGKSMDFKGVAIGALLICLALAALGILMGWLFSKRRHSMEFISLGLGIFLGSVGIFLLPRTELWCEPLFCGQAQLPAAVIFVGAMVLGVIVSLAAIRHFWPSSRWLGPVILTWFAILLLTVSLYSYGGLPLAALVALVLVLASYGLLHHHILGRSVLAVGDNLEAARFNGVSLFKTFGMVGAIYLFCVALAAFFETKVGVRAEAWWAYGRQVDAWLAIFLGGVALRGGKGCFSNVLLGVLLVSVMNFVYSSFDWPMSLLFAFKALVLSTIIWIQTKEKMAPSR
ncbi:MAG: hypothetical protein EA369_06925 [Bradymonadales bacterium]|nr:MAG: hypothetical protein EA369_06925 [Bradymonadales bacterium]